MARGAIRPVLKWAGGKSQLLGSILERLPPRIRTYYEPFAGGAAVFFALAAEGRFDQAVLGDVNPDLLSVYRVIKKDVRSLIEALERHRSQHGREHFYRVRAERPRDPVEQAARVVYLNKTAYNGLYRVNRSGQFNVPFGRYTRPAIVDPPRLQAAHEALKRAEIREGDFATIVRGAKRGDAVYFDPPYLPISATARFAEYDPHPFGLDEHRRLAKAFAALAGKRVHAVLSSSAAKGARELYTGFDVSVVEVRRAINSNASRRGPIGELLVRGGG